MQDNEFIKDLTQNQQLNQNTQNNEENNNPMIFNQFNNINQNHLTQIIQEYQQQQTYQFIRYLSQQHDIQLQGQVSSQQYQQTQKYQQIKMRILFSTPLVKNKMENELEIPSIEPNYDLINFQDQAFELQKFLKLQNYHNFVLDTYSATLDNLKSAFESDIQILHIYCHGDFHLNNKQYYLSFEDNQYMQQKLFEDLLSSHIYNKNHKIQLVFLAACQSEQIGQQFMEKANVPCVVCVPRHLKLSDKLAQEFTQNFYENIFKHNMMLYKAIQSSYFSTFYNLKYKPEFSQYQHLWTCCCKHDHISECKNYKKQNICFYHWAKPQVKNKKQQGKSNNSYLCSCRLKFQSLNLNQYRKEIEYLENNYLHHCECNVALNFLFENYIDKISSRYYVNDQQNQSNRSYQCVCCCELSKNENLIKKDIRKYQSHNEANKLKLLYKDNESKKKILYEKRDQHNNQIVEIYQPDFNFNGFENYKYSKALSVGRPLEIYNLTQILLNNQIQLIQLKGDKKIGKFNCLIQALIHILERKDVNISQRQIKIQPYIFQNENYDKQFCGEIENIMENLINKKFNTFIFRHCERIFQFNAVDVLLSFAKTFEYLVEQNKQIKCIFVINKSKNSIPFQRQEILQLNISENQSKIIVRDIVQYCQIEMNTYNNIQASYHLAYQLFQIPGLLEKFYDANKFIFQFPFDLYIAENLSKNSFFNKLYSLENLQTIIEKIKSDPCQNTLLHIEQQEEESEEQCIYFDKNFDKKLNYSLITNNQNLIEFLSFLKMMEQLSYCDLDLISKLKLFPENYKYYLEILIKLCNPNIEPNIERCQSNNLIIINQINLSLNQSLNTIKLQPQFLKYLKKFKKNCNNSIFASAKIKYYKFIYILSQIIIRKAITSRYYQMKLLALSEIRTEDIWDKTNLNEEYLILYKQITFQNLQNFHNENLQIALKQLIKMKEFQPGNENLQIDLKYLNQNLCSIAQILSIQKLMKKFEDTKQIIDEMLEYNNNCVFIKQLKWMEQLNFSNDKGTIQKKLSQFISKLLFLQFEVLCKYLQQDFKKFKIYEEISQSFKNYLKNLKDLQEQFQLTKQNYQVQNNLLNYIKIYWQYKSKKIQQILVKQLQIQEFILAKADIKYTTFNIQKPQCGKFQKDQQQQLVDYQNKFDKIQKLCKEIDSYFEFIKNSNSNQQNHNQTIQQNLIQLIQNLCAVQNLQKDEDDSTNQFRKTFSGEQNILSADRKKLINNLKNLLTFFRDKKAEFCKNKSEHENPFQCNCFLDYDYIIFKIIKKIYKLFQQWKFNIDYLSYQDFEYMKILAFNYKDSILNKRYLNISNFLNEIQEQVIEKLMNSNILKINILNMFDIEKKDSFKIYLTYYFAQFRTYFQNNIFQSNDLSINNLIKSLFSKQYQIIILNLLSINFKNNEIGFHDFESLRQQIQTKEVNSKDQQIENDNYDIGNNYQYQLSLEEVKQKLINEKNRYNQNSKHKLIIIYNRHGTKLANIFNELNDFIIIYFESEKKEMPNIQKEKEGKQQFKNKNFINPFDFQKYFIFSQMISFTTYLLSQINEQNFNQLNDDDFLQTIINEQGNKFLEQSFMLDFSKVSLRVKYFKPVQNDMQLQKNNFQKSQTPLLNNIKNVIGFSQQMKYYQSYQKQIQQSKDQNQFETQLLNKIPDFLVCRNMEIQQFIKLLCKKNIINIHGEHIMGKTIFAFHLQDFLQSYLNLQAIYINCEKNQKNNYELNDKMDILILDNFDIIQKNNYQFNGISKDFLIEKLVKSKVIVISQTKLSPILQDYQFSLQGDIRLKQFNNFQMQIQFSALTNKKYFYILQAKQNCKIDLGLFKNQFQDLQINKDQLSKTQINEISNIFSLKYKGFININKMIPNNVLFPGEIKKQIIRQTKYQEESLYLLQLKEQENTNQSQEFDKSKNKKQEEQIYDQNLKMKQSQQYASLNKQNQSNQQIKQKPLSITQSDHTYQKKGQIKYQPKQDYQPIMEQNEENKTKSQLSNQTEDFHLDDEQTQENASEVNFIQDENLQTDKDNKPSEN